MHPSLLHAPNLTAGTLSLLRDSIPPDFPPAVCRRRESRRPCRAAPSRDSLCSSPLCGASSIPRLSDFRRSRLDAQLRPRRSEFRVCVPSTLRRSRLEVSPSSSFPLSVRMDCDKSGAFCYKVRSDLRVSITHPVRRGGDRESEHGESGYSPTKRSPRSFGRDEVHKVGNSKFVFSFDGVASMRVPGIYMSRDTCIHTDAR